MTVITIDRVLDLEGESFQQVLVLRLLAYQQAGKIPLDYVASAMRDKYDAYATIALAKIEGRPAGTIRVFEKPERTSCDYARHPGFASTFPDLSTFVTGSRMAVAPAFQGLGLFAILQDAMVGIALQRNRRYIAGAATGWLVNQYERYGWTRTGSTYANADLGGQLHEFIRLDTAGYELACRSSRVEYGPSWSES